ncbi:iron-sulfur cluster repair di-iron protein [Flaviaesturariibacter aridisoli]|uniref:Iron-sulfur cluster repair di-iron protein n=1 Tax=Flaviaesturariibacter aridisoli TaxID=2545761 RepID=A0A4R4DSF2_9BACT|nr:iron-sulfur cluster repair di-iron protein [Flaviaesturariibacter aridisoli]TCZ64285.1 iron-sulfur cluster repair di-iron protein [Flaviaesturariibacter aridisoli]
MVSAFSEKTLAQIVTEDYRAAGVFARHGLDFCCKGKRGLASACAEKGIDANELAKELKTALQTDASVSDFNDYTLTELTGYIVRVHHGYIKLQGPQTYQFVTKVAVKHGDRYPHMKEVHALFSELLEELYGHMQQEEQVLFPRLVQQDQGLLQGSPDLVSMPIRLLEDEHTQAGELMAGIRELTHNYTAPEGACTTHRLALQALQAFETDLHRHVHLENNILFPKALK